jgi:hypothetical protein
LVHWLWHPETPQPAVPLRPGFAIARPIMEFKVNKLASIGTDYKLDGRRALPAEPLDVHASEIMATDTNQRLSVFLNADIRDSALAIWL